MNTIKTNIILFVFTLTILASCSKNDSPSVSAESGKIKITINGKNKTFDISEIKIIGTGDTVSYAIIGSDSLHSLTIVLKDIVDIKAITYPCGPLSDMKGGSVFANYDTLYNCDGKQSTGYVKIISISKTDIKGSFNFNAISNDDSTQKIAIVGEFNGPFIPSTGQDLAITAGKMIAEVNGIAYDFHAVAGSSSLGGRKVFNITGTLNDGQSLIFQFVNFEPKVNKEYYTGRQYKDSAQIYLSATFVKDSKNIFVEDSTKGGKIKIYKYVKGKNIQGTFSFAAKSQVEAQSSILTVRNGIFSATIKDYGK